MAKKQWYHKEVPLEQWMHKHLHFANDKEFVIFLVWAVFVSLFLYTLI